MNNHQIQNACTIIRAYHFHSASESFFKTEDQQVHDLTDKIMHNTCGISPIARQIRENKWDILFKNETWLSYLQGAQSYSVMDDSLTNPLRILSESFPVETEYYIIPSLLRK